MNPFINSETLKKVFGCPNPPLNITDVMDHRKILLVDIGGVSEVNTMFGTLIITKIQQATFRRHKISPHQRIPHFLYVDEFQECQTAKFNQLLSMAGGYGLRLCLAHQFVGQLEPIVRQAIFGNVSNYIVFRISDDDTRFFPSLALPYECEALADFPRFRALFNLSGQPHAIIADTLPLKPIQEQSPAEIIRNRTIQQYQCPYGQDAEPIIKSKRDDSARKPSGKSSAFPHER
jgi:hypothetical protein